MTFRSYDDIVAQSLDGRFRLTAKSPDNAPIEDGNSTNLLAQFQGQSRFRYEMFDTLTGKRLWSRDQPMVSSRVTNKELSLDNVQILSPKEPSPAELFVDNSGWTVVRAAGDSLLLITPQGQLLKSIGFGDILGESDLEGRARDTTAGLLWDDGSLWYFHETSTRLLFVIRTWWNRVVLIAVESGSVVDSSKVEAELLACERQIFARRLSDSLSPTEEANLGHKLHREVVAAAHWAGKRGLTQFADDLQYWAANASSSYTTVRGGGKPIDDGVSLRCWSTSVLRQACKTAIRRLGLTPGTRPAVEFKLFGSAKDLRAGHSDVDAASRAKRFDSIQAGVSATKVYELVGFPDFGDADRWSFDLDTREPLTIDIEFDDDVVKRVHRFTTPAWRGERRDREIFDW